MLSASHLFWRGGPLVYQPLGLQLLPAPRHCPRPSLPTDRPRLSLAFFCNTDCEALVEKIPTLPGPARHPPVKAGEYILGRLGLMRD